MNDLGLNIQTCEGAEWCVCVYEDNDQPMGIDLLLAGPDSDEYKRAESRMNNQRLDRAQRNKKQRDEHLQKQKIIFLVGCTLDWKIYPPAIGGGVEPPAYDPKRVEALYTKYTEIREQADRFIDDRQNFRGGVKGSAE